MHVIAVFGNGVAAGATSRSIPGDCSSVEVEKIITKCNVARQSEGFMMNGVVRMCQPKNIVQY